MSPMAPALLLPFGGVECVTHHQPHQTSCYNRTESVPSGTVAFLETLAMRLPWTEVVFSRVRDDPGTEVCPEEAAVWLRLKVDFGLERIVLKPRLQLFTSPMTPGQWPIHAFTHSEITPGTYSVQALFWALGDSRGKHKVFASMKFKFFCREIIYKKLDK